ncbi:hypothetical protein BU23DRAFT_600631 [Bimuria novae-zelandiae CBS 107.79]|uniref:Rhodopsin domain-containing protein n=1 Tax=Bimuria novae-zelandiae CBS 107.79 TaxID=1447943 RepID=A0A6A5VCD5_9PLEO|nr:hypothetical protein BU23DRAFT_600631 [Bimuria novae-zelandiae CBS 107.79]
MAAVPTKPPLHPLTADDRGSIIIIIAYTFIFITVLATVIRFGLAWRHRLHLKKDDVSFAIGAILVVASSFCFHIASNNGLGKKIDKVPKVDLAVYHKSMYAGELLSLAAQWAAKVSFLQLCERVAPRKPKEYNIVFSMVTFWGVFAMFAIAFQCGLPKPWMFDPSNCVTKGIMYYPVIIMNILTDIVLGTWILPTLWHLLMDQDRRVIVIVLFGSRLIVACVATAQLISVVRHILSTDVTYESFGRVLWMLCVSHLSVLQSTIPRTKKFIAALQLRTHATVRLTEFELQLPTDPTTRTIAGKELDDTFDSSEGNVTKREDVHTLSRPPSPRDSAGHRRSESLARSTQSERPLVPLQLTPSAELYFTTEIVAQPELKPTEAAESSTRYDANDWRKYLGKRKNKDDMNLSRMFSWNSRGSFARERIVQTKEVTQKVEVVQPKESRWALRKHSESSKRNSKSMSDEPSMKSSGQGDRD